MATIKQQYAANLVASHDFRKGTFNDLSSTGADLSPNGTPYATRTPWGNAYALRNSSYFEVSTASYPDLNVAGDVTFGGVFHWGKVHTANSYLLGHGGSAETEATNILYSLRVNANGTSVSCLHEYGAGVNVAVNTTGFTVKPGINFLMATRDTVNKTYTICLNGACEELSYSDNPSGGTTADYMVGSLAGAAPMPADILWTQTYNTSMSQAELCQMYEEWQQEELMFSVPKKTILPTGTMAAGLPEPILEYDMTINGAAVNDLSSSNLPATVAGCINTEGQMGQGVLFDGSTDARLDVGVTDLIHELSNASFCFMLEPSAFTDFDGFLTQGTSTTSRTRIGLGGSGAGVNKDILINFANGGTAASAYTTNTPLNTNAPAFIRVEFDGAGATDADKVKLFVNEDEQTLTFSGDQATLLAPVSANLYVGDDAGAVSREFRGIMNHLIIFDQNLTDAQGALLYSRFTKKLNLNLLQEDIVCTTSSQNSGDLSNTELKITSGSWTVEESSGHKGAVNETSGFLYYPSIGAFGTWWFTMNKAVSSTQTGCFLVCGEKDNSGTQEYYLFSDTSAEVKLWNGSTTILSTGYDLTVGVDYSFCITRTPKGVFTVYISTDGGATYTSIGTVESTTHTASKYLVIKGEAGDHFRDVKYYPLLIDPTL